MPSTTTTEHDVEKDGENIRAHQGLCLLYRLISGINNLSGMKEIYKMKQQHAQAAKILHLVCETVKSLDEETMNETKKALFAAARAEKVEFLLGMTKANPKLVSLLIFSHVFFDAVTNRRVEIVNLLRGFRFKHEVATMTVNEATMTVSEAMTLTENELHLNNLLYAAALLAPPSYLKHIYGAALQMQRELQWFKVIESMVDPAYMNVVNEGLNPLDIFKEKHKELRKDGERWMKDTASSCLVVGILIVAIMFAVAFIVPRGNNQALGYPISVENQLFNVFLISGVLSLFSATTSILTFLGIVTSSRYAEEDFLYSLPKKLFIGFSSLFLSIATMIVAFSVTLIIMLQHKSSRLRAFLPIAILGGILVTRFVILRFPLLVAVMSSIFGPGLFQKKVEKWP